MNNILLLGQPLRICIGRISPEEKGSLLLKGEIYLEEGIGNKSVTEINDYLEEYGIILDTLDIEAPGRVDLEIESLRKRAIKLNLSPPKGDYLIVERFFLSGDEFAAKVVLPLSLKDLEPQALVPLVLEGESLCDDQDLLVGFFYLHEDPTRLLPWLEKNLRSLLPREQKDFLREIETFLMEGKLPNGTPLPAKITFHELIPLEVDFQERYQVYVMEVTDEGQECVSLEIQERVFLE